MLFYTQFLQQEPEQIGVSYCRSVREVGTIDHSRILEPLLGTVPRNPLNAVDIKKTFSMFSGVSQNN